MPIIQPTHLKYWNFCYSEEHKKFAIIQPTHLKYWNNINTDVLITFLYNIQPTHLKYWNFLNSRNLGEIPNYSTDTFEVLKQIKKNINITLFTLFNRHIWSIETCLPPVLILGLKPFNRHIWSIETGGCRIFWSRGVTIQPTHLKYWNNPRKYDILKV